MTNNINHKERDHALLSASGAHRWLTCTPSARLEDNFPDKDTTYSLEGTQAHELSEKTLRGLIDSDKGLIRSEAQQAKAWKEWDKAVKANPELKETKTYIEFVLNKFDECITAGHGHAAIFFETRLDFSGWVPEGFGTGDVVIVYGDTLEIIDLKYGKGVPVDAYENEQLMLYGLGSYQFVKDIYDVRDIYMTIHQPRLDHVTQDNYSVEDLLKWANEKVKPLAHQAWEGEGEYVVGDHCRFCKAAGVCKARANKNLEVAKYDFAEVGNAQTGELGTLSNQEVGEILPMLDDLLNWANSIQAYALNELLEGREIPGYKVVEGRSVRMIVDEDGLAQALIDAGTPEAMIYERKLYGITNLTKIVGKKKFEEISAGFVEKPDGKPTLAPVSDKRPSLNTSAKDDFEEIE